MNKYTGRTRRKGTKCHKGPDDSLRQRVSKIGGEKFGVLVVDSSKKNAEVWLTDFFGNPVWDESHTYSITKGQMSEMVKDVDRSCRENRFKALVVGIEMTGRYHRPIKRELEKHWEVKIIHPFVTKQLRQPASSGIKTDGVDLEAMTRAMISGYGNTPHPTPLHYVEWQLMNRAREDSVDRRSRLKGQCREHLHACMPGYAELFTDIWRTPMILSVAETYGSAKRLLSAGTDSICNRLQCKGIRFRRRSINKVLAWASDSASPDLGGTLHRSILKTSLALLKHMDRDIKGYEKRLVPFLVKTPFVLLMSIPGINVVSASGYGSEAGPITNYHSGSQINGRAGIFPSRYQSDETDRTDGPMVGGRNARLRNATMRIASNMVLHSEHLQGWSDLRVNQGWSTKKAFVSIANHFSRIAFQMVAGRQTFHHPHMKEHNTVLKKLIGFSLMHEISPEKTISLANTAAKQLPADAIEEEIEDLQNNLYDLKAAYGVPRGRIKEMAPLLAGFVTQVRNNHNEKENIGEKQSLNLPCRVKAEILPKTSLSHQG